MFEYAIAYYDSSGKGTGEDRPFVYVGLKNEGEARVSLQRIRRIEAIGDACIFCFRKDKRPEAFTADFVEAHRMGEWC